MLDCYQLIDVLQIDAFATLLVFDLRPLLKIPRGSPSRRTNCYDTSWFWGMGMLQVWRIVMEFLTLLSDGQSLPVRALKNSSLKSSGAYSKTAE